MEETEGFIFVPEHGNPVAVQDNHITNKYLVDAMSFYLDNFGSHLAASVDAAPDAVEAVAPIPPADYDPIVMATTDPPYQSSLSDFWSFT